MKIEEIIPYERNARYNDKAVPAVAESIREFGFKGAIVLRSHDDPTIVNGHTRVKACKALGWTEIPDENIVYADDLTDEQVKALRLADNRTAEIATWNKALLKSEIRSLENAGLDMSRFRFDFKSKALPYGAERLKTDRGYNLDLVAASDCGKGGWPHVRKCMCRPSGMTGFNYAMSMDEESKGHRACHFFIDDYQFERVWSNPARYLDHLKGFQCVLTPDFSLYMDMPLPMMAWNHYRSQALGMVWQREGMKVVPTLSWAGPDSFAFCFEGIPKHGTVAVSTVGVKNDDAALATWRSGMAEAMRRLEPRRVLLYGGDIGFDFGKAEVVEYRNDVTDRMGHGR